MDVEKVKAIPTEFRRTVHITLRVSPDIKNWLIEKEYSATSIFHEAIKELGYEKGNIENIDDEMSEEQGDVYYSKRRIRTSRGWRTKHVKQYKRGKGNVKAQKARYRARQKYKTGRGR